MSWLNVVCLTGNTRRGRKVPDEGRRSRVWRVIELGAWSGGGSDRGASKTVSCLLAAVNIACFRSSHAIHTLSLLLSSRRQYDNDRPS